MGFALMLPPPRDVGPMTDVDDPGYQESALADSPEPTAAELARIRWANDVARSMVGTY